MVRRRSAVRFRMGAQYSKAPPIGRGLSHTLWRLSLGLLRDAHGQDRHVVGGRFGGEALDRAQHTGRDRPRRQAGARGEHVGEAVVAEHAGALAALGDAVGHAEQDVTRVEGDRLLQPPGPPSRRAGAAGPRPVRPSRPGAGAAGAGGRRRRSSGWRCRPPGATTPRRGASGSGCGRPRRGSPRSGAPGPLGRRSPRGRAGAGRAGRSR